MLVQKPLVFQVAQLQPFLSNGNSLVGAVSARRAAGRIAKTASLKRTMGDREMCLGAVVFLRGRGVVGTCTEAIRLPGGAAVHWSVPKPNLVDASAQVVDEQRLHVLRQFLYITWGF